jgi:hypothetical protein
VEARAAGGAWELGRPRAEQGSTRRGGERGRPPANEKGSAATGGGDVEAGRRGVCRKALEKEQSKLIRREMGALVPFSWAMGD